MLYNSPLLSGQFSILLLFHAIPVNLVLAFVTSVLDSTLNIFEFSIYYITESYNLIITLCYILSIEPP